MKTFKFILLLLLVLIIPIRSWSQTPLINSNLLGVYGSQDDKVSRFQPMTLSFNTHHWQNGGSILVEVFQDSYVPAYAKYIVNVGYGFGANWGEKQMILVESSGEKYFDLEFGPEFDLGVIQSGYPNKGVPIYLKMKPYLQCRIRVTHSRNIVQTLQNSNQIQFPAIGTATVIPDFTPSKFANDPLWTTSSLRVQGNDNHYIAQGNFGIGTTTPGEKLSVNGNIRAHEIKVESSATTWPDYVFDQDYDLPKLEYLKIFIAENKHLPNVPNATTVERDGVSLGEMNKILLQKVEELTLYMLQAADHAKKQDEAILELKTALKEIRK